MTAFLIGMLGALFAVQLVLLGMLLGRRQKPKAPPAAEQPSLAQEQAAFRTLMHYSPEIAYGEAPMEEE